jgi:hypothetical protein
MDKDLERGFSESNLYTDIYSYTYVYTNVQKQQRQFILTILLLLVIEMIRTLRSILAQTAKLNVETIPNCSIDFNFDCDNAVNLEPMALTDYTLMFDSVAVSNLDETVHEKKVHLPVQGQGIVLFSTEDPTKSCSLHFYTEHKENGILVEFTTDSVVVKRLSDKKEFIDPNNKKGLVNKQGAYYWISLDSQNQRMQAGIGEARVETAIYTYQFEKEHYEETKAFLESLHTVHLSETNAHVSILKLIRDPITAIVPLLVKNTNDLSMHAIANGSYLPKSYLSPVAQRLYDCISGSQFVLDDSSFPDFSKAIEYSINTPGLWCNTRLKEKANEFSKTNPNFKETYLRITLGQNNGESPGIPYVMEIWPIGHYSPIHSHAGANAVIRVLHGSIHVKLYPFLCAEKDANNEHFSAVDFPKNSITWISPTLNQIHKLENLEASKQACITIQCYMYDSANTQHYDYFDYIDSDGVKQQYEPDSDMDFLQFKERMKQEWAEKSVKKKVCASCAAPTASVVSRPTIFSCLPSFWWSRTASKTEKKNR